MTRRLRLGRLVSARRRASMGGAGTISPRSQRATVLGATPTRPARTAWVIPLRLRHARRSMRATIRELYARSSELPDLEPGLAVGVGRSPPGRVVADLDAQHP